MLRRTFLKTIFSGIAAATLTAISRYLPVVQEPEKVIDIADVIYQLDPDQSPLTKLLTFDYNPYHGWIETHLKERT